MNNLQRYIFLLLVCISLSICGFSQFYLGLRAPAAAQAILNDKDNYDVKSSTVYGYGGSITWRTNISYNSLDFTEDLVSSVFEITPINDDALQGYKQSLNNRAVIISNNEWHLYTNGEVIDISLMYINSEYRFLMVKLTNEH